MITMKITMPQSTGEHVTFQIDGGSIVPTKETKKKIDFATSARCRASLRRIGDEGHIPPAVPKGGNWVDRSSERYLLRSDKDGSDACRTLAKPPRASRAISSTGNSGEKQGQGNVRNASYCDPARRFAKKGGSGRRVSERMRGSKNSTERL